MVFRRFVSLLLSTILGFQSIFPTIAMQSLEDLEQNNLRKQFSVPANLSFKAQPGRTAAGTFLYALRDGKIYFLLGQRREINKNEINNKKWCNSGGGSEENDGKEQFLVHTAVRETDEELNRLYCPHSRILKNQPFIDTYNGSLYYRMYWHQVQYLDEKVLIETLQGASAAGQEFTDFAWLEAFSLLQAVESQQPLVEINSTKQIELYPEFFTTLSTLSGKAFLKSLVDNQKIKRFDKNLRPLINQLYFVGEESSQLTDLDPIPPLSWPMVSVDSMAELETIQKQAVRNMHLSPLPICPTTKEGKLDYLVKRAAFLKTKDSLAEAVFEPNAHQVIALEDKDKKVFAGAVAAHLGSMIELKELFLEKEAAARNVIIKNDSESEDSYSDMSLRIVLGPDYKTPDHFSEAENPQDAADDENIKTFLDRYYGTDELGDGKRDVKVLPSDHALIKSILQWERHKACPTFYNATSDTIYSLTLFFTHLRKYMMVMPLKSVTGFRGTDIYFKGIKTMEDAIERYGYKDYTPGEPNGRSNLVLCGNATALAGLKTTRTSSSSIEYVMNNHTVRPPNLGSVIQEALALSGFNDPTNKYFHALFQQFIAHNHPEYANSVMFAIQLRPDLLETYTYPAFGGGSPFTIKEEYTVQLMPDDYTIEALNSIGSRDIALYVKESKLFCKVLGKEEIEISQEVDIPVEVFERLKKAVETNTTLQPKDKKALLNFTLSRNYSQPEERRLTTHQVFEGLRVEYNKQKESEEPFEQDKERKRSLLSEIRILPHPEIVFNPEKFLVTSFPRFPIPNEQMCKRQMDLMSMAMIADWLENENCILEGSFHQYPVAKKFYNRVHLGVTGNSVQEKLSWEGLFHLVQHGHVEAVKGYIETYPNILEHASKDQLILAALRSNVPDMLKLVLVDLKDALQIEISEEEMTKFLRIAKDFKWDHSATFILDHMQQNRLDISKPFLPVLYQLLQPELKFGLPDFNDLKKRITLLSWCTALPEKNDWLKELIIDHLFTTSLFQVINEACSEILFPHKIISPLDMVFKVHQELCSPNNWGSTVNFGLSHQQLLINFLKQIEQNDGYDMLFQKGPSGDLLIFDLVKWGNPLCKDLLTYLKTKPALFTIKNNEGLGLLAAFQKAHLEGYPAKPLTSFITIYKQEGLDLSQESYPPFFQLYGHDYKEDALYADHASLLNQSWNRQWALQLANATPPQDLSKLLETCPDGHLWKKFSHKLKSLQLSEIIHRRQALHSAFDWMSKLEKALYRKKQNNQEEKLEQKKYNPFDCFENKGDLPYMMNSFRAAKAIYDTTSDQFPGIYSLSYQDTEEPQSLSDLLAHIPESISSVEDILEKLKDNYYYKDLDVYFQSLPEFSQISSFLEKREEGLFVKRTEWLNRLKELVETNDVTEIYHHMENIPYLRNLDYAETDELLRPYMQPVEIYRGLISFDKKDKEKKWVAIAEEMPALIQKDQMSPRQIEDLIRQSPSPAALRKSLHIFLKENMVTCLPMVLSGAYGCATDFAKENLFHQELHDNIYAFPRTYRHPFPYALMAAENVVLTVQHLQPYLDAQYALDLLRGFDTSHLWKLIKNNKPKDVRTLVTLMPWMFQWHQKDKDFFLFSIQHLPKPALSCLVMKSLDLLKITEMSRCLPYFVHLMMDGGNVDIINQALIQDPSLLEIQSLDGLKMDDFLTFYASPPIVKIIHTFQKRAKDTEKIHS